MAKTGSSFGVHQEHHYFSVVLLIDPNRNWSTSDKKVICGVYVTNTKQKTQARKVNERRSLHRRSIKFSQKRIRFETELEHEPNNAFSGQCTLPLRNAFLSFLLSKFNPFKTNLNEHRDLVLTKVLNRVYLSLSLTQWIIDNLWILFEDEFLSSYVVSLSSNSPREIFERDFPVQFFKQIQH